MGREIRKVPANWEHPKDENGHYIPMYSSMPYNKEEIKEGLRDGWLDKDKPNYGIAVMPVWPEEECTHIQLYETTTEGTPASPVYPKEQFEQLCEWLADNATTFADFRATKGQWMDMLRNDFVHAQQGNVIFT